MDKEKRFFGLHFDYHACLQTKNIGANFDPTILERIIKEVKPDFIQCDTKGHPGLTSYATKVGVPAPGMVKDLLAQWRKVTKEYGVPLYSHYSGIWDKQAAIDHPDWAAVYEDGTISDRMSVFGDYEEARMIPQLKELIKDYDMDGAWVDGDCWGAIVDYSKQAQDKYEKEFGAKPPKKGEDGYSNYLDFNRKGFVDYVRRYVDAVHSINPKFMITSNWMNTAWFPDDLRITDFISGDLSPTNSVDSARFDGRVMAMSGRMWDIMSWGIGFPVHHTKGVVQLEQEAAIILALGGGFQIYNMQDPTNVCLEPGAIKNWAEVSSFCHERKPYCYESEFVPDLGMLYCVESYYDGIAAPFWRPNHFNDELYGNMLGLLDQGASVNVVSSQRLSPQTLKAYPRFALSDVTSIKEETKRLLLDYVNEGGELLLLGANTVDIFAPELGLSVSLKKEKHPISFLCHLDSSLEVRSEFATIEKGDLETLVALHPADVAGDVECTNPPPTILKGKQAYPGLAKMAYGKGAILLAPINLGQAYLKEKTVELTRFFSLIAEEFSQKAIVHNHPGELEAIYTKKEGKRYLHLINLLGPHRVPTIATFDSIPPLMDVNISLKVGDKPSSLTKKPSGEKVDFAYDEASGRISFHLDSVSLYDILCIEGIKD